MYIISWSELDIMYVLVMYCIDFSTQPRELKHEPAAFYKGRHSTGGPCTPSSGFRQKRRLSPWDGNVYPDQGVTFVTFPFVNVTVEILQLVNQGDKYCTVYKLLCKEHLRCKSSVHVFILHICANLSIMLKSKTTVESTLLEVLNNLWGLGTE
jgi:hypothetical protein